MICEIILDKNDPGYTDEPKLLTLTLRDACIYYKRFEIQYLDREHTIIETRGGNVYSKYINRIDHTGLKIKILYIEYLKEEDRRVNVLPLKEDNLPSVKTELSIRIRP